MLLIGIQTIIMYMFVTVHIIQYYVPMNYTMIIIPLIGLVVLVVVVVVVVIAAVVCHHHCHYGWRDDISLYWHVHNIYNHWYPVPLHGTNHTATTTLPLKTEIRRLHL